MSYLKRKNFWRLHHVRTSKWKRRWIRVSWYDDWRECPSPLHPLVMEGVDADFLKQNTIALAWSCPSDMIWSAAPTFLFASKGYLQQWRDLSSCLDWRSGHLHTRQYITCGSPLWCDTCSRPSADLGIVTHLSYCPLDASTFSRSSTAPSLFNFFSFFQREETALWRQFSTSPPCSFVLQDG